MKPTILLITLSLLCVAGSSYWEFNYRDFVVDVERYVELEPQRLHMHERLTLLKETLDQLDRDIEHGSDPKTIQETGKILNARLFCTIEDYSENWEVER